MVKIIQNTSNTAGVTSPVPQSSNAQVNNTPSSSGTVDSNKSLDKTFTNLIPTPQIVKKTNRQPRKAINSKAVHLCKELFQPESHSTPERMTSSRHRNVDITSAEFDRLAEEEEIQNLEAEVVIEPSTSQVKEVEEQVIGMGDYVVGKLLYNFGTRKQYEKHFVGKVLRCEVGKLRQQYEISFLRKQSAVSTDGDKNFYFIFPNIVDKWLLDRDQIIQKIVLAKEVRGKFYFTEVHDFINDIEKNM